MVDVQWSMFNVSERQSAEALIPLPSGLPIHYRASVGTIRWRTNDHPNPRP